MDFGDAFEVSANDNGDLEFRIPDKDLEGDPLPPFTDLPVTTLADDDDYDYDYDDDEDGKDVKAGNHDDIT